MGVPLIGGPFDGGEDHFLSEAELPPTPEMVVGGASDLGDPRLAVYRFDRERRAWVFDAEQTTRAKLLRRRKDMPRWSTYRRPPDCEGSGDSPEPRPGE